MLVRLIEPPFWQGDNALGTQGHIRRTARTKNGIQKPFSLRAVDQSSPGRASAAVSASVGFLMGLPKNT